MAGDRLSRDALASIDRAKDRLIALSLAIHADPELAYDERRASARCAEMLRAAGYAVRHPYCDLATSFRADAGSPPPTVAILCEYDALPNIGHACGHNLIAMMGLAAAIGLATVRDAIRGRISIIGTPAEEGGGGKVALLERGGFDDVEVAMMVHPSSRTIRARTSLASARVELEFRGRASHAAARPDQGLNALDGLILTFVGLHHLRQQLRPDARVAGIITNGGSAPNIIPDLAVGRFSVRALDREYRKEVLQKFIAVAEGAAAATGTSVEVRIDPKTGYENMIANDPMANRFAEHLRGLGVEVFEFGPEDGMGSTDMGNISQVLPSIHPYIKIAPEGTAGHSTAFRDAAAKPEAHKSAMSAAKAMALTAIDLLRDAELLRSAKEEFRSLVQQGVAAGRERA